VRLKGGDPFVFGRGGEEVIALARAGVAHEVVPGISSATAAPLAAGIPVTHRGVASAFLVLAAHDEATFRTEIRRVEPHAVTLVVLMGMRHAPGVAAALIDRGWSRGTPAAVIVDATRPNQHQWAGRLDALAAVSGLVTGARAGTIVVGDVVALARPTAGTSDTAGLPSQPAVSDADGLQPPEQSYVRCR
jgi:siroheme synthase